MVPAPSLAQDTIPRASEVLAALRACGRVIRDAQTEVIPFGTGYRVCANATASLEALALYIEGESDSLSPRLAGAPQGIRHDPEPYDKEDLPL